MNIILYSTGCPKCDILKKKLSEKQVEYVENNSTEEMLNLGLTQVPVLSVDGELLEYGAAVKWINGLQEA